MINNLILVILLILILILYGGQNFGGCFAASFVYLTCAPLLVIGGREMNSSYLLTALLLILTGVSWMRRPEIRPHSKSLRLFVICMGTLLLAYTAGYFVFGTAGLRTFAVAMAGELNVILLVVALALLLFRIDQTDLMRVLVRAILVFVIVNVGVSLLQILDFVYAYRLMDQLYVSEGRFKPLLVMLSGGSYDRISGTFFSPVVLGTTLLLCVVLLSAHIIGQNHPTRRWGLLLLIAVMTVGGILAFSKIFMLGIPAMMFYWMLYLLIFAKNRRKKLTNWGLLLVLFLVLYAGVYFALPGEMTQIRDYYYQYFLNPFSALHSRYAQIDAPLVHYITDQPPAEPPGIVTSAFEQFKQHPVFGVGPVPVADEFLGDSQLITTAHHGGIVALLAYLVFYVYVYVQAFRRRNLYNLSLIPALAMGCVAVVMLTLPSSLPFIALLIRWEDYSGKLVVGEDGLIQEEGDLHLHVLK